MRKSLNFVKILKSDKSVVLLIAIIAFYLALLLCLPLRTTLQFLTLTTAFLCFPLSAAYHRLKNFTIKPQEHKPISFWYFFLINLAVFSVYFYATYPGYISPDTVYQWSEVQKAHFSDWHPAIHIMIIWCLTRICNKFQFVLIFQAFVFMILNSSLCYEMSKLGLSKKLSKWVFFLTIISPATCSLMMTIWKDISFAISVLGLTEILILTYFSGGRWIKSNLHSIIFGIVLALATMLRHNGILFTLPFAVVFLYLFFCKYVLRSLIIAVCLVIFVKFPLYSYLEVSPHPQPQAEMCGLPMTVLSEIFVNNPSVLDQETTDFLLSIENRDTWMKKYESGSWNSIKYLSPHNKDNLTTVTNQKLTKFSMQKILLKAIKSGFQDHKNTLNALINLTGLVWRITIFPNNPSHIHPINSYNASIYTGYLLGEELKNYSEINQQIKYINHDSALKGILQIIIIFFSFIFCIFWCPGIYLLLLILSAFFSFHRLRWKSFLIISPILVYNFGTMLLLCGYNDFRFFFFNVLITFPYMFLLFADKKFITNQSEKFSKK